MPFLCVVPPQKSTAYFVVPALVLRLRQRSSTEIKDFPTFFTR